MFSNFYDVVDNGYKYNTTDINSAIGIVQLNRLPWLQQKREKIAQLILMPIWNGEPEEVHGLNDTERGAGGFGSTGVKK